MTDRPYYKPPTNPLPDDEWVDAMNALRTTYGEDGNGGWLSNIVWNSRNNYLACPESKFEATQVRMLVEGFMAEIAALRAGACSDAQSPTKVMSVLEAATQAVGHAMVYGTGVIVRDAEGFYKVLEPSKYTLKEKIG